MNTGKKLSNAASTGGAGPHFEAHVQAAFVTLMLTGGFCPCLPAFPIREVKLQGKVAGYDTDDLIVITRETSGSKRYKLLAQVKRTIAFRVSNKPLRESLDAAWRDYNNHEVFSPETDAIALITSHLNETDAKSVIWILDQAKHTSSYDDFFSNVQRAWFSPPKAKEKLDVIRELLKLANSGKSLSDTELYDFLNCFHILGFDLGKETGVVLSLLCSHMSQFNIKPPEWAWSRIVEIVQIWNQDAGTIIPGKLPRDLREKFRRPTEVEIPEEYAAPQEVATGGQLTSVRISALVAMLLIGQWDENLEGDSRIVREIVNAI